MTAVIATVFCLAGGLIFLRYDEKDVLATIMAHEAEAQAEKTE